MKLFYKIFFSKKNILHHFFDFFFKKGVFPVRKGFLTYQNRVQHWILKGKSRKTGWISTDRHNEASLLRTIPASIKSSTKDFGQFKSWDEKRYTTRVIYTQWYEKTDSIRISRVSSLEAFSCYPTSGSVAALFPRTTAFTGYSPQRFLSYWVAVLSECKRKSRIKLTCLATV